MPIYQIYYLNQKDKLIDKRKDKKDKDELSFEDILNKYKEIIRNDKRKNRWKNRSY